MPDTVTVEIKSRLDNSVLFSAEVSAEIDERFRVRAALEIAVKARANLAGAYLVGANLAGAYLDGATLVGANLAGANLAGATLDGANLAGATLDGAYLVGANLAGATLDGANLAGANLAGATLDGAYLVGAYLVGANLAGANLVGANLDDKSVLSGERPIFQLGPIGSESRTFVAYITRQGLRLRAGCFFGTRDEFAEKLNTTHGDNVHAHEYTAALALIDEHYRLWSPKSEAESGEGA